MAETPNTIVWPASEKLKDSSNYPEWRKLIRQALLNADVWQYAINKGIGVRPENYSIYDEDDYESDDEDIDINSASAIWAKGNAKAYMIIHKTVGADALKAIRTTDIASEAWKLLKDRYQNKGFYLIGESIDEFLHLTYNKDQDIANFNDKFKNAMMKIQDAGLNIPASFYIHLYLSWTQESYPSWSANIRAKFRNEYTAKKLPDQSILETLMNDLLGEDRQVNKTLMVDNGQNGMVLYGNHPKSQNKGRTQNTRKNGNKRPVCTHCKQSGHTNERCFELHPEKRPTGWVPFKDRNKDKDTIKPKPALTMMAIGLAAVNDGLDQSDWLLDTGASHHICNNRRLFVTYEENASEEETIMTVGSKTRFTGQGTVHISVIKSDHQEIVVELKDVLYIPEIKINLLSGPKIYSHGIIIDGSTNTLRRKSDKSEVCTYKVFEGHMRIDTLPTPHSKNTESDDFNPSKSNVLLADSIDTWHRRLGHLSVDNIKKTAQITAGVEISSTLPMALPRKETAKAICEPCVLGKSLRTQSRAAQKQCLHGFDKVHIDVVGPIDPTGFNGHQWAIMFTDDCHRARWLFTMKNKGDAFTKIIHFVKAVQTQYSRIPKIFRLDNGTEYGGNNFSQFCASNGITIEWTVPYTPEQNAVSERTNRTILERARTMIIAMGNPDLKPLWPEVMRTAIYLTNRVATRTLQDITPLESLTAEFGMPERPDLSNVRTIGCTVYYHLQKEKRRRGSKFDGRAKKGILVGFEGSSIYRIYDPTVRGNIVRASAVTFDESTVPCINLEDFADDVIIQFNNPTSIQPPFEDQNGTPLPDPGQDLSDEFQSVIGDQGNDNDSDFEQDPYMPEQVIAPRPRYEHWRNSQSHSPIAEGSNNENFEASNATSKSPLKHSSKTAVVPTAASSRPSRTAEAKAKKLQAKDSLERNYLAQVPFKESTQAFITQNVRTFAAAVSRDVTEPLTYQAAITGPDHEKWIRAMQEEYENLTSKNTWQELEPPKNTHILNGKWVYKIKRNKDNQIIRYKARWVVKGYEQQYGVDYEATYAAVAKSMSFKTILAIAAAEDYEIEQMDAVAAFLNGDMTEHLWVELPHGFQKPLLACLLNKGLYGLKQSSRLWSHKLRNTLKKLGYDYIEADECIYFNAILKIYVVTYVDDFLLIGATSQGLKELKLQLCHEFEMTDLGPCLFYLGIEISRDRPSHRIHLAQTAYIDKVLKTFNMADTQRKETPMEASALNSLDSNPDQATKDQIQLYQSIVGSLMYLMTQTRPDLAFCVSFLSRFAANPSTAHMKAAKRTLQYLKATRTLGITYNGKKPGFYGYSDSDWAGDRATRRSTSGYLFYLYGGVITWRSTRQKAVTVSSTEAEYYGLTNAAKEAAWLRKLLTQLQYSGQDIEPTLIYGDNQSSLALAEDAKAHQRSKHVDIQYHYIRQQVQDKRVFLSYVETQQMVADGLTKPLTAAKHAIFIKMLGLEDWNG